MDTFTLYNLIYIKFILKVYELNNVRVSVKHFGTVFELNNILKGLVSLK